MPKQKSLLIALFLLICAAAKATTWDEPWHNKVVKQSQYFVLAKITGYDETKGVTISILKQLGGSALSGEIKITNFYLLNLCSTSSGEGPEFHFANVDSCYFFLTLNDKKQYCIATPTTGYAAVQNGHVVATYRHSYQQALVDGDTYEKTMTAIFNNYHGLGYDTQYINGFVDKYLAMKPAGLSQADGDLFFNQHVALECIYHLNLPGHYNQLLPFLRDTANLHNQISAARALGAYDTDESTKTLLAEIGNPHNVGFMKVMCVWALQAYKPRPIKAELVKLEASASEDEVGFGGNIMDPRVCTSLPNVKEALIELIKQSK